MHSKSGVEEDLNVENWVFELLRLCAVSDLHLCDNDLYSLVSQKSQSFSPTQDSGIPMTLCGVAHAWSIVVSRGQFDSRCYSRHSWGRFLSRLGVRRGKLLTTRRSIPLQWQRLVDIQDFVVKSKVFEFVLRKCFLPCAS